MTRCSCLLLFIPFFFFFHFSSAEITKVCMSYYYYPEIFLRWLCAKRWSDLVCIPFVCTISRLVCASVAFWMYEVPIVKFEERERHGKKILHPGRITSWVYEIVNCQVIWVEGSMRVRFFKEPLFFFFCSLVSFVQIATLGLFNLSARGNYRYFLFKEERNVHPDLYSNTVFYSWKKTKTPKMKQIPTHLFWHYRPFMIFYCNCSHNIVSFSLRDLLPYNE